jgi:tRNA (guanine37-N1)-methyltransferase
LFLLYYNIMTFHIITLFPESFDSYINSSIIGRAIADKKIKIKFYNPRDFTRDKWRRVDQKPYGGGPGMVLEAEAVIKAIEKAITHPQPLSYNKRGEPNKKILVIWLSPSGKQFDNIYAEKISKKYSNVVIICGRYEGIDERVLKVIKKFKDLKIERLSIGPFVLTGGELPAMVILDTIARRIPGVLGKIESLEENRISSPEVYTRPEILEYKGKKYRVPKVLLSGHRAKIEEWKSKRK